MLVDWWTVVCTLLVATVVSGLPGPNAVSVEGHNWAAMSDTGAEPYTWPGGVSESSKGWQTLPKMDGAKVDNTTFVLDSSGTTALVYINENYDPSKIKRVVVQLHGQTRDAWNLWSFVNMSADAAIKGGAKISKDEILIVAPMFVELKDTGVYEHDEKNVSTTKMAIWASDNWGHMEDAALPLYDSNGQLNNDMLNTSAISNTTLPGDDSEIGKRSTKSNSKSKSKASVQNNSRISTADVLDAMLARFTDQTQFPNVNKVVMSGFSLGGQLMTRYTTVRPDQSQDSRIFYLTESPASFLYLTDQRPEKVPSSCQDFNQYKYGLEGTLPDYFARNNISTDSNELEARRSSRTQFYFVGSSDNINYDKSCAGMAQGNGHLDRLSNWVNKVLPTFAGNPTPGKLPSNIYFGIIDGVSHDEYGLLMSPAMQQPLFLQDYNGQDQHAQSTLPMKGGSAANYPNGTGQNSTKGGKKNASPSSYPMAAPHVVLSAILLTMVSLIAL